MNLSNSHLNAKWQGFLMQIAPDMKYSRYRMTNMVLMCVGLFKAGSVHLGHIARSLPVRARKDSLVTRLRRFMKNEAIDVRVWYSPIVEHLLNSAASGGQITLIIDGSKVSSHHQLLMVALAYQHRALPLVWDWVPHQRGHSTVKQQRHLLASLLPLIPAGAQVILMGDTEFGHAELLDTLDNWDWHYVLRQRGNYLIQPGGCDWWQRLDNLPLARGGWCPLGPAALTFNHAYPTHLIAYWKASEPQPWLLATNVECYPKALRLYAHRNWIEQFFGDVKRHGFNLEATRFAVPDRLSRLTLIVCLVYIWLVGVGDYVLTHYLQSLIDRSDRRDLSIFRLGWDFIERCLALDDPIPPVFFPAFSNVFGS